MSVAILGLLFDAAVSLWGAWAIVALVRTTARRAPWTRWLLLVPFAKVFVDLAHGLASDAYTFSEHAGVRWELGRFAIGFGVASRALPYFDGRLGARFGEHWYALGAGDMAATLVARHLGAAFVVLAVTSLLGVGVVRAALRVVVAIRFERARRRERTRCRSLARIPLLGRTVDVYVSEAAVGGPYAGGLLRPYVAVPPRAFAVLDPGELHAALLHEVAHVCAFDAPLAFAAGLAHDVLWFVPGAGRLLASFRAALEHAADGAAVDAGADPLRLASAIANPAFVVAPDAAAMGIGGHVRARVLGLLAPRETARASRVRRAVRLLAFAVAAHAALASTFLTKV